MPNIIHRPVLLAEVLEALAPKDGETYIDATFGGGGYTKAILAAAKCKVIAIDQDPSVKKIAEKLFGEFQFIEGNFGELENLIHEKVDGIVFDIGVSSMQIDNAERGFSFMKDGPLDMRMGTQKQSAADFLNSADEKIIADVIYNYGEEKFSRKVAKEIVHSRPLATTTDLVNAVHRVLGKGGKINSATKTFQAIRIYINDELEALERALAASLKLLKNGGRLVVVTFHSLEDRIVKKFFRDNSAQTSDSNFNRHQFFNHQDENKKNIKFSLAMISKRAIMPKDDEVKSNPRARSAKLRIATKIGD